MDEVGYIYVPSGCKSGLRSIYYVLLCFYCAFSALTRLVWRQEGIRPVKTEWWVAGVVICLERGADLHMAQLMPLPLTVSLLQ